MKKRIIYFLASMLIAMASIGQTVNDRSVPFHVTDSTTNFNSSLRAGTIVFDETAEKAWKLNNQAFGTDNLSTMSKVLLFEGATAGGDGNGIYSGSGSLSGNTTVTGVGNNLTFTGIQNFSLTASTNFDLSSATAQMRLTNVGASPISLAANGTGDIQLDAAGGKVRMQGLFYPNSDGSAGQAITTDGLGNLSFSTISADNIYTIDGTLTSQRRMFLNDNDFMIANNDSIIYVDANQNNVGFGGIPVNTAMLDIQIPQGTRVPFCVYEDRPGGATTGDNMHILFDYNDVNGDRANGTAGIFSRVENASALAGSVNTSLTIGNTLKVNHNERVLISENATTDGAIAFVEIDNDNSNGALTSLLIGGSNQGNAVPHLQITHNSTGITTGRAANFQITGANTNNTALRLLASNSTGTNTALEIAGGRINQSVEEVKNIFGYNVPSHLDGTVSVGANNNSIVDKNFHSHNQGKTGTHYGFYHSTASTSGGVGAFVHGFYGSVGTVDATNIGGYFRVFSSNNGLTNYGVRGLAQINNGTTHTGEIIAGDFHATTPDPAATGGTLIGVRSLANIPLSGTEATNIIGAQISANSANGGTITNVIGLEVSVNDVAGASGKVVSATFTGGNVGMGTVTPDNSAILQVASTTQGFLPPRMTTGQRNAIVTPADGLMIYNITTGRMQHYDSFLGIWINM